HADLFRLDDRAHHQPEAGAHAGCEDDHTRQQRDVIRPNGVARAEYPPRQWKDHGPGDHASHSGEQHLLDGHESDRQRRQQPVIDLPRKARYSTSGSVTPCIDATSVVNATSPGSMTAAKPAAVMPMPGSTLPKMNKKNSGCMRACSRKAMNSR